MTSGRLRAAWLYVIAHANENSKMVGAVRSALPPTYMSAPRVSGSLVRVSTAVKQRSSDCVLRGSAMPYDEGITTSKFVRSMHVESHVLDTKLSAHS